jgi:hypothetical protein
MRLNSPRAFPDEEFRNSSDTAVAGFTTIPRVFDLSRPLAALRPGRLDVRERRRGPGHGSGARVVLARDGERRNSHMDGGRIDRRRLGWRHRGWRGGSGARSARTLSRHRQRCRYARGALGRSDAGTGSSGSRRVRVGSRRYLFLCVPLVAPARLRAHPRARARASRPGRTGPAGGHGARRLTGLAVGARTEPRKTDCSRWVRSCGFR